MLNNDLNFSSFLDDFSQKNSFSKENFSPNKIPLKLSNKKYIPKFYQKSNSSNNSFSSEKNDSPLKNCLTNELLETINGENNSPLNNNKNNNNISFENNLNNNNIIKLKKKSKTPINKNNINLNNNFLFKNNNNIITFDTFNKTRNNINNIFNNDDKTKKIKTKKKPLHYNLMNHSFIPTSNVLSFNLYNLNREKDFNNNTFNNNNHKKILSKSMTKEQRKNYLYPKCHGEFMYKSFMENLPKKEKKRQEIINEREKELYKELIFHPKINKNSKYNNKNNNNKIEKKNNNKGKLAMLMNSNNKNNNNNKNMNNKHKNTGKFKMSQFNMDEDFPPLK